ncbi:hypothetical protein [Halalkalicoccus jeotgali]|uniref:hypothetical protein n=1 Tax=Halalkalicoccus jeotgali TaxID=413810 RepID=UPI001575BD0F|nr:hypothetical protein [Halalkalicoccus jeotgali]
MEPHSQRSGEQTTRTTPTRRRVLKTGLGAIAAAGTVPLISGTAAAHFPDQLEIDIRPNCDINRLNTKSNSVVPVAVLPTEFTNEDGETEQFDPTENDVRYRFGAPSVVDEGDGARPAHDGHTQDNDEHEDTALVLHFPLEETGFDSDTTEGKLVWERDESGEHGYSGTDTVTVTNG